MRIHSAPIYCIRLSSARLSSARLTRRPRRVAPWLLAAALFSPIFSPIASASTIEPMSLSTRIYRSELVFQGVVTHVDHKNSEVTDPTHVRLPHTYVTYSIERVWKGASAAGSTITLRMQGGPDGEGRFLHVAGVPSFRPGDRDILFVSRNGPSICPLVGWMDGRLRAVRGDVFSDLGQEIWLDGSGRLALGEVRIRVDDLPYLAMPLAVSDEESDPLTPPAGAIRPDLVGFGAVLERMVAEQSAAASTVSPVPSLSIGESFFVRSLRAAPPASDAPSFGPLFSGRDNPAEVLLIEKARAAKKRSLGARSSSGKAPAKGG